MKSTTALMSRAMRRGVGTFTMAARPGSASPSHSGVAAPATPAGLVSPMHMQAARALSQELKGDWKCSCGLNNFARRSNCFRCGLPKDASAAAAAGGVVPGAAGHQATSKQPDEWMCLACQSSNRNTPTCFMCLAARPQGAAATIVSPHASFVSIADVAAAGEATPSQSSIGGAQVKPGDWHCPCGSHNFASRQQCFKCQAPRLQSQTGSSSSHQRSSQSSIGGRIVMIGDWVCPSCMNHNFKSRTECRQCGQARAPDAKELHAQDVMKPGDWLCACGEHNFKKRGTCRKCGLVNPAAPTVSQSSETAAQAASA